MNSSDNNLDAMSNWMRIALISTGVLNMLGAALFFPFFPELRDFYGLPSAGHPLYLWILATWIGAFGFCYLYLGLTGGRERLFLVIGATGKISFFALLAAYWFSGAIELKAVMGGSADLFFGMTFLYWLWTTRKHAEVRR